MMMPTELALHYCEPDAVVIDFIHHEILVAFLNGHCFALQVDYSQGWERGFFCMRDGIRAPVSSIVSHHRFDSRLVIRDSIEPGSETGNECRVACRVCTGRYW